LAAPAVATEPPAEPSLWAVLKAVGETAVLFGFFASITGWSYLSSYYSSFGFRPMEIDVSSSLVSLYALNVVYESPVTLTVTVVVVLLVSLLHLNLKHFRGVFLLVGLLLVSLGLYKLGSQLGKTTAHEDVWDTSNRLPSIALYASETEESYPDCVSAKTPTLDCRLLFHGKGVYYFFKPFEKPAGSAVVSDDRPMNLEVYALPESKVRFVQYQRGVQ
jgi:hypothetical protein